MSDKISIGAIGCGNWGANYIRAFNELQDSRAAVCADLDPQRLECVMASHFGMEVTTDYRDILNDPRIDAVVVSTPASTHYQIVKDSLSHGKHVLVEKPFTMSVDHAEELVRLTEIKQRVLMVGHIFVYNPAVQRLKDYTRRELGDIVYLHASRTGLGPIRNDANAMWDLAPHDISTFMHLLESEPLDVSARGQAYLRDGLEDVVFMTLRFPKRILASVHVSWLDPRKVRRTTVVGTTKMAVFDDTEILEKLKLYDRGVTYEREYSSFGEFQLLVRDGDILVPKIDTSEPLKNECRHFIDCIKSGTIPKTDGREGLRVVRVLAAAEASLRNNGSPVRLVR